MYFYCLENSPLDKPCFARDTGLKNSPAVMSAFEQPQQLTASAVFPSPSSQPSPHFTEPCHLADGLHEPRAACAADEAGTSHGSYGQ